MIIMSRRNKHRHIDAERTVAEAMKQVERAMKHVKVATRGMDDIDLGDSPGAGITHEDDDTEGAETKINKDGSIKIDKKVFGKKTSIHIHNSKNVQVGNNNVMVINQTANPRRRRQQVDSSSESSDSEEDVPAKAAAKPITDICQQILSSNRPADDQDIRRATTMIGKKWRRVGRSLNVSDADLEQIYIQHFREDGIRGVVHQVFTKWKQINGKKATVGALTTALSKVTDHKEIQVNFEP
ncbi:uncharacterized protein LOC125658493 [Ostrea edulis]|uniref:uncharacterized protein LOC125658493 n=1 Tax=Ostrea edulis TaxID=37623 RepID=UPI002095AC24|nr:uncharacterized protein LOC125658493 [Ostrea edulis]XP_048745734.1 uncharacterized protein LOC125658493 [Ostrea edulis]XP_048745741.1 uncharacterized protein LOC125658493 [Ostrea edulis]XP_048745748.1 uncharacterized protein LOC125658493 [Ostrea edulis]XP_056003095.1 uncharacterized protein LOC125658493 [Ostrea edulis]XP_056003098.1 uncharacterized protein LOC125658493 [Ostrea edulis]